MHTIADVGNEIHGAKTVAMFISPAYDATLAQAIQHPGMDRARVHHLLLVFRRSSAPSSEPCLVITSESPEGRGAPVLGMYGETGKEVIQQEHGDWTDIVPFGRTALELAGKRLDTIFTEYRRTGE